MFNNYKKLIGGKWEEVNQQMIWPLTRWASGSNPDKICPINKHYFCTTNRIKVGWLSQIIKGTRVGKYPKGLKDTPQWKLICETMARRYKWSKRECLKNKDLILTEFEHKAWVELVAKEMGWENKQRKLFKLDKLKLVKAKKEPGISIFDF